MTLLGRGGTLRSKLGRLAFLTLGIVALAAIFIIVGYSFIKMSVTESAAEELMKRNLRPQIESMMPSLLMPEQKVGLPLLFDRLKEQESLSNVQLLQDESELPKGLAKCDLNRQSTAVCFNTRDKEVTVITPIREGKVFLGYFLKSKRLENQFAGDTLVPVAGSALLVLLLTFFALFSVFTKITSKEVPDSLNELVQWIEEVLQGKISAQAPNLRYQELNDLGKKIAEIIERHDLARDQAVIGQVTSGILHDIRTPLHSLVMALHLADEVPAGSPKRLQRLENLFSAAKEKIPVIGEIIEGTLDGGRMIHVERKAADLNETVRSSLKAASETTPFKGMNVSFIEDPEAGNVPHDRTQLNRVFLNLIKNAAEAQAHSKDKEIHVQVQSGDGNVRVTVDDAGPGLNIPKDQTFRAFRSTKSRGTGLGLFISKKIVDAHGGSISVNKSSRLSGACFEVTLPGTEANA